MKTGIFNDNGCSSSPVFPWSGNCTIVYNSSITLFNFWQKYWWIASSIASYPPEPTNFLRDLLQLENAQFGGAQLADQQVVVLSPASLQHHISPLPALLGFSHLNGEFWPQNIIGHCWMLLLTNLDLDKSVIRILGLLVQHQTSQAKLPEDTPISMSAGNFNLSINYNQYHACKSFSSSQEFSGRVTSLGGI